MFEIGKFLNTFEIICPVIMNIPFNRDYSMNILVIIQKNMKRIVACFRDSYVSTIFDENYSLYPNNLGSRLCKEKHTMATKTMGLKLKNRD